MVQKGTESTIRPSNLPEKVRNTRENKTVSFVKVDKSHG